MTDEKLEANWDTWDYGSREPLFLPLEDFTEREKERFVCYHGFIYMDIQMVKHILVV